VAVETLGAVTVVATDKTGTLTFGEMMVERVWVDRQSFRFSGAGYDPHGKVRLNLKTVDPREFDGLTLALRLGAMNNDGRFTEKEDGTRQAIGDPTELALIVAAGKAGWSKHDLDLAHPRLGEFPFDYTKKYMVTWHQFSPTERIVTIKGAPREVMALCSQQWTGAGAKPFTAEDQAVVMDAYERWASEALRGLAVAQLIVPADKAVAPEQAFGHFTFVGLFGIADAVRPEAAEAIRQMHRAGIRVIMLTGDYQKTGIAIGRELGLVGMPRPEQLIDGADVDNLDEVALRQRLAHARIGTRLTPEHKLRMAHLMKQDGAIVAMTGDGINDVPALIEANVGIAVGQNSSDAAKEAADILLIDGNFQSITAAIAEGRRIFRNIRRVMFYLLASNFGELVLVVGALLVGLPLPLLPKQIIWLNAGTDPFMGIALAREPQSPLVMQERPHDPKRPIIEPAIWRRILMTSFTIGISGLVVFFWAHSSGRTDREVYAVTLTTVALSQWLVALNARSSVRTIFSDHRANPAMLTAFVTVITMQIAILYIPALAEIFDVAPLSGYEWLIAILGAAPVVVIDEIRKWWFRHSYRAVPVHSQQP
jgi:Ca2+-transporting ATPase